MNLPAKYAALFAIWFFIFHALGLKEFLIDYSLKSLPNVKAKQSIAMWLFTLAGGEVGTSWAVMMAHHYLRRD
jgi:hypothetical protein